VKTEKNLSNALRTTKRENPTIPQERNRNPLGTEKRGPVFDEASTEKVRGKKKGMAAAHP